MSQAEKKGKEIIELIKNGQSVEAVKAKVSNTADEWHRYSSKAYIHHWIMKEKKEI
jgi:hypothetical protein